MKTLLINCGAFFRRPSPSPILSRRQTSSETSSEGKLKASRSIVETSADSRAGLCRLLSAAPVRLGRRGGAQVGLHPWLEGSQDEDALEGQRHQTVSARILFISFD